jgi:hypothetical protein
MGKNAFPFSHVVPLGVSCRVTCQVRLSFDSWKIYPFDWWITPLDGLIRYLADPDVARLYAADALEEMVGDGEVSAIRSRAYGFRLFHDFPRRAGANSLPAVSPDWRTHLAEAAARHEKLMGRLLRLNRQGNRVLFVRHRSSIGNEPGDEGAAAAASLWNVLRARWKNADIRLLLVNFPAAGPLPEGVLALNFEELPGPPGQEWRGDENQWKSNFTALGLKVRRRSPIRIRRFPGPGKGFWGRLPLG